MKLLLLVAALALLSPACSRAEQPGVVDQKVEITLIPAEQRLQGVAVCTLSGGGRLALSLSPRVTPERVLLDGDPVPHRFRNGALEVQVPDEKSGGRLRVEYGGRFDDPVPQRIVSSEDPTFGVSATISPAGTFLGGGSGWYPEPKDPPAQRTFTVRAPSGIRAVTAGRLLSFEEKGGEAVSVWRIDKPLSWLQLSAGRYIVRERREQGVLLSTWFLSDDEKLSGRYLDALSRYLDQYTKLLGPYPFEKFAVVENFLPTGYGYPSYTLIGGSVLRLPFILTTSLPHEFVHSWWGTGVDVAEDSGNWSEGLTAYLSDYLLEELRSPEAGREHRLKLLADYSSLVPPQDDFPLSRFRSRFDPASRAVGYGKSAMVFHLLRRTVGDEAFFAALRELAREKMFSAAGWDDFGRALSRTSGREVAPLLRELVNGRGGIEFSLEKVKAEGQSGGWMVTGNVRQETVSTALPVTLHLEGEEGAAAVTVQAPKGFTPFAIRSAGKPVRLVLDPEADIFRRLQQQELPPTVNRLKGSKNPIVIRCRSWRGGEESIPLLLESLGLKGAKIFQEGGLSPQVMRGRDLLYLGAPAVTPAAFPQGFALRDKEFSAAGKSYSSPGETLLVMAANPLDPEKVAGYFVPLSPEGAARSAVKVTHYGKYGYLVFRSGENVAKGGFSAGEAPGTVVRFSR